MQFFSASVNGMFTFYESVKSLWSKRTTSQGRIMVIESLHIASKMGKMLALVLDRKFVDQTESEENNITFPRRCIVSFTGERDFAPEDGLVIRVEDIRKNYQVTDKYEILKYMMRIIANNKA